MSPRRRLTLALLTAVLAATLAAGRPELALADDGGGDNVAAALNTRDGSSVFRLAFKIRKVGGEIVDATNAAVAVARCERCRTTAIAIQIVLATGSPSTVTPQNVAIALNEGCSLCETFAAAYQFVLGTGGPVRFTDEGRRALAEIRRELRALSGSELSPAELDLRVSQQMDRLRSVLATQLQPTGVDASGKGIEEDEEQAESDDDLEQPAQPTEPASAETGRTETIPPPTETTSTETTETEAPSSEAPATTTETVAP